MFKSFLHIVTGMILISPLSSVKTDEVPPDLVYHSQGCGHGCIISQISKTFPEQLYNGWIRVKVGKTWSFNRSYPYSRPIEYNFKKGEEGFYFRDTWIPKVSEGWVFANCSAGLYGSGGLKQDMSDSKIRSIYWTDDSGNKHIANSTADGFTYMNWKKLCNQ